MAVAGLVYGILANCDMGRTWHHHDSCGLILIDVYLLLAIGGHPNVYYIMYHSCAYTKYPARRLGYPPLRQLPHRAPSVAP